MGVDLDELANDLTNETAALERVLDLLSVADWDRPTPASGWAIRDQISHLAYFDEAATRAARSPDQFRSELAAVVADVDGFTETIAKQHRDEPPTDLYAWFRAARRDMIDTLTALDPSLRVPWYGPDMSVASSLTARIMETWAHGQDVFDAIGVAHPATSALQHVAFIGARTFANSFVTRGLAVPENQVFVSLHAPNGDAWAWGDPGVGDRVEGDAVEFCLVVTQRRHVADTQLRVQGDVARQWMEIAQAFAGPPGTGRAPSTTT